MKYEDMKFRFDSLITDKENIENNLNRLELRKKQLEEEVR